MDTSEKIVDLRRALNLSQEELADRVGVARQTVVSWEQGARPSAFNRRRICEEFALPVNYFDADVVIDVFPEKKPSPALREEAPSGVCVPRAANALRRLGTLMRWGSVVLAGLLFVCVLAGVVLILCSAGVVKSGALVLLVNPGQIVFTVLLFSGIAAVFYSMCFFLRLLLRELLCNRARRK